jgi:hypothetical protein
VEQEQDNRLPIQVRVSYILTDDELNVIDKLDHRFDCNIRIDFTDLQNPVEPDARAIEFHVRNYIAEILERHPKFGGEDGIKPWVEITQMSWRPDVEDAEELDMVWLLLPRMTPRQVAALYATAYKVIFDET